MSRLPKNTTLLAFCLCLLAAPLAPAQTINTIAGGGAPPAIPPDGTKATAAAVGRVSNLAVDSAGNVYFLSDSLNRLFEVGVNGSLTTAAGPTIIYYTQGPGQNSTDLQYATGVAVDTLGGVLLSTRSGVLELQNKNTGSRTSTAAYASNSVIDTLGNVYLADTYNHRVLKNGGTLAGIGTPGYSGDGVAAATSSLNFPTGVAVDAGGNVYIADAGNHRIRMVSGGIITTVAGTGTPGSTGDFAAAANAQLNRPTRVALDSAGNLYIADSRNHRIREVSNGIITTVAGTGVAGYSGDGKAATSAQLSFPEDVAVDSTGALYVADLFNNRVRKVVNGIIDTIAGNGGGDASGDGAAATSAFFATLFNLAGDRSGNLYFGDGHGRVRMVSGGVIQTVAGNGTFGYSGDGGPATSAQINDATAVAVDSAGNLYIADQVANVVRKVSNGIITTIAGNGSAGYSGDGGPATSAQLSSLSGLAVDKAGNLYISDRMDGVVRRVTGGVISTFAGNGQCCYTDSGPATSGRLESPVGLAADAAGNLYIAGQDADVVQMVSGGIISTVAGIFQNGHSGSIGDGGPATSALVYAPAGVAVDASGNLYIADVNHARVRQVSGGQITTVAGNGIPGTIGDGGPATSAELYAPWGLAIDSSANLYIADAQSKTIRQVALASTTTVTIATNQTGLAVVVDGVTYPSPQTFSWTGGSHTIGVVTPQSGTGARYAFLTWSDSGAQTHTITAPFSATYTANFTPQYPLVTVISPSGGGIVSATPASPDGYYNSGVVVQLTAVPNPNFQFTAWSGDLSGAANPQSLIMNAVHHVTAGFASSPWPVVGGAQPTSGSGTAHNFTFQFLHPSGFQSLSTVNILINNFIDGRSACYLAYSVPSSTLYLVNDAGAPSPYAGSVALGSSSSIQNSQCTVGLTSANGSGNTLTLNLAVSFTTAFAGNRILFLAAGDVSQNNSGWVPSGVWQVPGAAQTTTTTVTGMTPATGSAAGLTSYTFSFSDTKGYLDLGVENILINRSLDGRHACYLAYVRPLNLLYLVNDNGDALLPAQSLSVPASLSNSQCTVSWGSTSVASGGNNLSLSLNIGFTQAFGAPVVFYLAARDGNEANNTGWQPMGTWTIQ